MSEFSFKSEDDFRRKQIAEKIIKMIATDHGISPLIIDGPWGSGKTVFCKKMIDLARETQPAMLWHYVDCFRYDDLDDPLMMLITSISSHAPTKELRRTLIESSIPIAKVLGKTALKSVVNVVLKANADQIGEDLEKAISKGTSELIDEGIKKTFEDFEKAEESITLFKKALATIAQDKKIVLILDELDRCKPNFALSVFEKVKHVFDVEGVQFIFSVNLKQLGTTVRKQYGYELDAETYLSKFYRFSIQLSDSYTRNSTDYRNNAFSLFFKRTGQDEALQKHFESDNTIYSIIEYFFIQNNVSLRDAEKFYFKFRIFNAITQKNAITSNTNWPYVVIILTSIFIQTFKPEVATRILREGVPTVDDLNNLFGKNADDLKKYDYSEPRDVFYAIYLSYMHPNVYESKLTKEDRASIDQDIARIFSRGSFPSRSNGLRIVLDVIRDLQFL